MIRILQVVTNMGRGGIETMLMNYFRKIDRSIIQFDFLVHRDGKGDYDDEILSLGGRIYHVPRYNPFSRIYRNSVRIFFEKHKEYQIVHSHINSMSGIVLQEAARSGVPIRIAHSHCEGFEKSLKVPIKKMFIPQIPRNATHYMACSEAAGKFLFGNNKHFIVLPNAIEAKKFRYNESTRNAMRKELSIPDDNIVLGHVGRFLGQKNHVFLIDIFQEVVKKKNATLLLIGDGELKHEIKRRVEEKHLSDKVIFAGVRSDVPELMQAMDIFVFPSLFEGLGVAAVEAQAAGLPTVISDCIPSEVIIAKELVSALSLKQSAVEWAENIISKAGTQRTDTSLEIIKNGYDASENVKWLTEYYQARLSEI